MFYSQIILAKKGPLGQVWQAAHWGAKKLGRPAVFSTDIAAITTSIANPTVPMALRVSGHLLLGIVRIYSRQVQFLLDDCHQAMVKVKMAYSSANTNNTGENGGPMIDITVTTRGSLGGNAANASRAAAAGSGNNALNISNFGEFNDAGKGIHDADDYYNSNVTTTHFAMPLEELLQRASDVSGMDHTDDDWVPAELDDSTLHISSNLMNNSGLAENSFQPPLNTSNITGGEDWGVFDPNDGEGEEEEEDGEDEQMEGTKKSKEDDGSTTQYSDIEVTRAVNDSTTSDQVSLQNTSLFCFDMVLFNNRISLVFFWQVRRASMLQNNESGIASNVSDKGGDSIIDTHDFPMNLDDDDHQNVMMDSDDDDDDSELARRRRQRHSLRLSESHDDTNNINNSNEIGISFAASTEADIDATTTEIAVESGTGKRQQRPRKRRKIITDDGRTELSSDHIRTMIADTSDICRDGDLLHPATWTDAKSNSNKSNILWNHDDTMFYDYSDMDQQRNRNCSLLWNTINPQERLFCRPALGDDGHLSSELLDLWSRNCAPVMNRPFSYVLEKEDEVENLTEEDHDIEQAREHRDDNSEILASDQPDEILGGNDPSFEMGDGNDNAIPFDDEDDRMPMPDDEPENLMASDSTFHLFLNLSTCLRLSK